MDIPQHVIGFFIVLMLAALLVEPLARRLHLPFSAVLVLTGLAGAQVLVAAGIDLGLRWFQFHDMVLYVLLPVIVFEAALTLDLRQVRADLVVLAVLALPVTLVSAAVTAALFLAGTGHAAEVGWGTALLAGTLLSATDPAAVLDLFHRAGVPHRLSLLAEGESLFNSGLVVVAAGLLLERVLDGTGGDGGLLLSGRFVWLCAGGAAVGALIGAGTVALLERLTDAVRQGLASLTGSYLAFWVAHHGLGLSGIMAVLAAGLIVGLWRRRRRSGSLPSFLEELWAWAAYAANAALFLLVGVTISLTMFREHWLAMLVGIGAALAGRAVAVFGVLGPAARLPGARPVTLAQQAVLFWGGLRGAVTTALALSLPLALEDWLTVQSAAYGVVLFTLFVQAPTLPLLLRRLRL